MQIFEFLFLLPALLYFECFEQFYIPPEDGVYIFICIIFNHVFNLSSIFTLACFHPIVYSEFLLISIPIIYLYLCIFTKDEFPGLWPILSCFVLICGIAYAEYSFKLSSGFSERKYKWLYLCP